MHSPSWSNWSGSVTISPTAVARPRTLDEIRNCVTGAARAGGIVKAEGARHSFTAVAATTGIAMTLDDFAGVEAITPLPDGGALATVRAGIRLHALNPLLWELGLALPNLGDFAEQSVAGAASTGTHGTGRTLPGIAAAIVRIELVTAGGDVIRCSADEEPEIFQAARIGVGALGVITRLTLRCVPAFALHAHESHGSLSRLLEDLDGASRTHDHVEFFWFPHTDGTLTKHNTRLPGDVPLDPLPRLRRWFSEEFLANTAYEWLNRAGAAHPPLIPRLNRIAVAATGTLEYTDRSYRVFASPRSVRFVESEYAVPVANATDVLRELREWIDTHDFRTAFPVEVRFAAADDIWLSTASGRDVCYIAVHQYHRMGDHAPYFAAFEAIARAHGGRPHWGKMHSMTAPELAATYPHFEDFLAVRDLLDPGRTFANAYTRQVFGD